MTRQRVLEEIDAEEFAHWRAFYVLNGGFGEDKADKRAAYEILFTRWGIGDSKASFNDCLRLLNPSVEVQAVDVIAKAKAIFEKHSSIRGKQCP